MVQVRRTVFVLHATWEFFDFCVFSWRVVPLSAELDSLRIKSRIIEHRYCRGNDDEVNHLCWSEIAGDSGKSPCSSCDPV